MILAAGEHRVTLGGHRAAVEVRLIGASLRGHHARVEIRVVIAVERLLGCADTRDFVDVLEDFGLFNSCGIWTVNLTLRTIYLHRMVALLKNKN